MRAALILILAATFIPGAVADNLFAEPICAPSLPCVTPVVCVSDVICQETTCTPAATCAADTTMTQECRTNQTLESETCQQTYGGGTSVSREGFEFAGADASLIRTQGHTTAHNLQNGWETTSVDLGVRVLGVDPGRVSVTLYNSTIQTSNDNEARQYGVGIMREEGSFLLGRYGVAAGVVFYDDNVENCYVRTSGGATYACSDVLA